MSQVQEQPLRRAAQSHELGSTFLIKPFHDPAKAFDPTELLIDAIARELNRRCGGNIVLNRIEAAAHVARLLSTRSTAHLAQRGTHQSD